MKPLDVFMPIIHRFAPGCPEPTAFAAIREAAIKFCERTRLWRCDDEFNVGADECAEVAVPYGAALYEMELVQFNGRNMRPVSTQWLDEQVPDWRTTTQSGQAQYVTQQSEDTLTFVPAEAGSVRVYGLLKPTLDADSLPDLLADTYRKTIADGALSELLIIPGKAWMSADLAVFFGTRFDRELDRLSTKTIKGQQRAPVRTRAQFF
ncbi:hypothetical protein [Ralstonia phage GP4]|uniref:Uncharacterized protein n=1 Tax=Ralstonia phage GP4 TaxID=2282904 RepID=A0A345GU12_9CAUD|nr:virion structural protein [Ralstonia phage GP4]8JOV_G Chain G, gp81 of phage GP4 [Ralstonia phage GP4]8JOV_H Chain H, gp81 of phage GP4 [Ralstonia phage GP4]8JOV_I Chain I, gp81 of phage GP4 [Ralstonia phage GP4]8JOV_J Chain J, gp81 of phage GP4 [Ralstonia phage GP4]8JOV_K Chain K, gp81 of phage GP4 [Ralstonia phage GP4]8JOV_L Chain L, gp81 of phage GP4 [Ralstonia phage GP4]8JOV_S Chain S, gp81 of phage GP4 [Ralstonia phage GP4]8JOV_W Chain W, gp81 of phage GP4 [Ralstonia phage GP4]8JOV